MLNIVSIMEYLLTQYSTKNNKRLGNKLLSKISKLVSIRKNNNKGYDMYHFGSGIRKQLRGM